MKFWQIISITCLIPGLLSLPAPPAQAEALMELYGNFHAMGITITLAAGDDPDSDASAQIEYRTGLAPFQAGFPLARVADTRFVGSLFWLEAGTAYDVRVVFSDPDGGPLDGAIVSGSAFTRPETAIPPAEDTFYASASGDGTACSLVTPCTLVEALNQAQAGDQVMLRGGVYYAGQITLPRSGAEGAPIVIRSYPGETAALDGGDPRSYSWQGLGDGLYHTSVDTPIRIWSLRMVSACCPTKAWLIFRI